MKIGIGRSVEGSRLCQSSRRTQPPSHPGAGEGRGGGGLDVDNVQTLLNAPTRLAACAP